ncbi:MAG: sel1 repeat family protein [Sphingomonadales bacterium]|nr:sel1 repeat family protein [Sphingomonadales bacterium]
MAMIRRFALLLAVLATSLVAEPTAAATEAQLLATCRSYDVSPVTAAAACQTLGFATRKGENEPGKVIDWPKALWFHDRACTLGDAGGCMSTGFLYTSGKIGMSGNPPQPALEGAFSYFRRGCELSAAMCFVLATAYERGKGISKNLATADQLYARACTAQLGLVRIPRGALQRETGPGWGGGAPREQCEKGRIASACTSLAGMTEKGIGMAANSARAAQLRQTACGLDKAQCAPAAGVAATKLAPAPAAAPKPVPAPTPAAKPAEKPDSLDECNTSTDKAAAAKACELLGTVFGMNISDGQGADHEASGRFFHRACSLGLASGCRNLGTKFLFGEIGKTGNPPVPNHKLAVVYFRKACDLDAMECTWLGLSFERGEGVSKDLAEAQRLYHKRCAPKMEMVAFMLLKLWPSSAAAPRHRSFSSTRKVVITKMLVPALRHPAVTKRAWAPRPIPRKPRPCGKRHVKRIFFTRLRRAFVPRSPRRKSQAPDKLAPPEFNEWRVSTEPE